MNIKCTFCNSNLTPFLHCKNHKINVRFDFDILYIPTVCFDINKYTLVVTNEYITVFKNSLYREFYTFLLKVNNTFLITPDNAESVLFKLLSLKAFS
jgi:hypothetical protein